MQIGLIISAILFSILSGLFKAICDLSEEDNLKFKNKKYWIKAVSWVNKWKCDANGVPILVNGKRVEKRWLSSTVFVMLYDAWHLFGVLFRTTFAKAYICVGLLISINIWYAFASLGVYVIFATAFHIFYTYKIFRK